MKLLSKESYTCLTELVPNVAWFGIVSCTAVTFPRGAEARGDAIASVDLITSKRGIFIAL